MNDSIRLGTLRGIRVGVHWSVAFVAWLLAWGLATRLLPAAAPGAASAAYWAAGISVAGLFFGSLLLHELAHAFFARRAGIRVEGITLWLLGGVAKLDGDAPTPGHELRIAASGPIVSGLLGFLFLGASAVAGAAAAPSLVVEATGWLARVNLVLALFNLLPGAPLDGGRIVRAVAWRLGRDRLRATLLATMLGRALGFGLIAFGLFELVAGQDLGALWTIVIGLFMTGAAAAERTQEVTRGALAGLRVRDVMAADPLRVPAGITVDLFTGSVLAPEGRTAALVVEAEGTPVGVAGLAEASRLRGDRRRDARVRDIAIPLASVPVASPDDDLLAAFERSAASLGRGDDGAYLLVVEDGAIVGLVSPVDLARSVEARLGGATAGATTGSAASRVPPA